MVVSNLDFGHVAISPDSRQVAATSPRGVLGIWDMLTNELSEYGEILEDEEGTYGYVWGVSFSPDGDHIAATLSERGTFVVDLATGGSNQLSVQEAMDIAWSADGSYVAAAFEMSHSTGATVAHSQLIRVIRPSSSTTKLSGAGLV